MYNNGALKLSETEFLQNHQEVISELSDNQFMKDYAKTGGDLYGRVI